MDNFIILSEKSWNKNLAVNLPKVVKGNWILIDSREDFNLDVIKEINPKYIFIPHWSHYIPEEIYNNFNCIIFHMTDLPYGRGGSPLQNLIVRGFEETKISAVKAVKALDAGPVYLKEDLKLLGTAQEIFLRANDIIEQMIVKIAQHSLEPVAQVGEVVEFLRRKPKHGNISDTKDLKEAFDYIRMLDAENYPSAFLEIQNFKIKFTRASLRGDYIIADAVIERKMNE